MNIFFQTIFRPQSKFQENTLLVLGIGVFLIGCLMGNWMNVSYDGAFDVHLNNSITITDSLLENTINVLSVFVPLYIFGKIIYPKTRWIDVLNASLLYRIPIFFIAPFIQLPIFKTVSKIAMENKEQLHHFSYSITDLAQLAFSTIFTILLLVHAIVLLVNGFKTATNTKKWQHFVLFGFILIVAEIISKILIIQI